MCKEHAKHTEWTDDELRIGILQLLYTARQRNKSGGAAGKMLIDCLDVALLKLEQSLRWLADKKYIALGERVFLITEEGVQYLLEQLGPGNKPPTDPSRVPRHPLPTAGAGSIALPLPEPPPET